LKTISKSTFSSTATKLSNIFSVFAEQNVEQISVSCKLTYKRNILQKIPPKNRRLYHGIFKHPFLVFKYRVWIFPGQTLIGVSETTANIYIRIVGEKSETGTIKIQNKTTLEVEFSTQNMGRLVTLTIGHDNKGLFPSWKVDNVLVRNEVTGAVWYFPCGKRLGKSVADGALERILPAERLGLDVKRMSRERRVVVSSRHGLDFYRFLHDCTVQLDKQNIP